MKLFNGCDTDRHKASQLMVLLDGKSPHKVRRFVACLLSEDRHLGHEDIATRLMQRIPSVEAEKIRKIVKNARVRSVSPNEGVSRRESVVTHIPRLCVTQIELVGELAGKSFHKLDTALWSLFSTGKYNSLGELTRRMNATPRGDYKIVALWFDCLIAMHRDHDYSRCLTTYLMPALLACKKSRNRTILEGRIYQRMAQVYLTMGHKDLASMHFERAEVCLQFVGRGYDKVNMLCRRAKLLAATKPQNRDEIEGLYSSALQNVTSDDPFALASQPSLVLSKAAFHLRMPFGARPTERTPSDISAADIAKARNTLQSLPTDTVILVTRKCEYKLLSAELLRLDDEEDAALSTFDEVIRDSECAKLDNLVAIACQRSSHIRTGQRLISDLLRGIPGLQGNSSAPSSPGDDSSSGSDELIAAVCMFVMLWLLRFVLF